MELQDDISSANKILAENLDRAEFTLEMMGRSRSLAGAFAAWGKLFVEASKTFDASLDRLEKLVNAVPVDASPERIASARRQIDALFGPLERAADHLLELKPIADEARAALARAPLKG